MCPNIGVKSGTVPPPFLSACLQSGECISTSPVNTRRSGRGNGDCVVDDDVVDDVVVDDDVLDDVVAGEVLDDDGSRAGSDPTSTTGDDDGFSGIPPRACPIRTPASVAHAVTMIAASATNALRLLTCSHRHTHDRRNRTSGRFRGVACHVHPETDTVVIESELK